MNHKEKLLDIYKKAYSLKCVSLPTNVDNYAKLLAQKSITQKGVFTVFVTLAIHKILNPQQDIRLHQEKMKNGFSGRTVDTKYITPTLKELNLPSMAESGWLTRSLEQPFPYNLDYKGNIRDVEVKEAFLNLVDFIQNNPNETENLLIGLLYYVIEETKRNKVEIIKLENPEKFQISDIIDMLVQHFFFNYHTFSGSKLPVIAFYAIYQLLLKDIKRYNGCVLKELGHHTTCDTTSKSSGDIEVFKNTVLVESLEIKFQKEIDVNIVRIAQEKIYRHNPKRYYILSTEQIKDNDKDEICSIVREIQEKHGCQLILNGVIPSLKYYLRLISSLEEFLSNYSYLIEQDTELKPVHKSRWNEIVSKYNNMQL